MSALRRLGRSSMEGLADALRASRLQPPYSTVAVGRFVEPALAAEVAREMTESGLPPAGLAWTLSLLAAERADAQRTAERVELVWTGPEAVGTESRDTAVVVGQLFSQAARSVLIAGYAMYDAAAIFEPLRRRMIEVDLIVRMFFNVDRPRDDFRSPEALLADFARIFRERHWTAAPWPQVFSYVPALSEERERSVLHAKCIVVDDEVALVTSANFTPAAQERNVEAGILVRDPQLAQTLAGHFEGLVNAGLAWPLALG